MLLIKKIQKTFMDFAKNISNISLYLENWGTAIFKEHLSVVISVTKNFDCNLPFLF